MIHLSSIEYYYWYTYIHRQQRETESVSQSAHQYERYTKTFVSTKAWRSSSRRRTWCWIYLSIIQEGGLAAPFHFVHNCSIGKTSRISIDRSIDRSRRRTNLAFRLLNSRSCLIRSLVLRSTYSEYHTVVGEGGRRPASNSTSTQQEDEELFILFLFRTDQQQQQQQQQNRRRVADSRLFLATTDNNNNSKTSPFPLFCPVHYFVECDRHSITRLCGTD